MTPPSPPTQRWTTDDAAELLLLLETLGAGEMESKRSAISSQRDKEKQHVENLCYPDEYAVDSPISLMLLNPAS